MPLKNIQCIIQNVDIISLLISPLNKVLIAETVDILYGLVIPFGLTNVYQNKIILIKGDFVTMRNITCAIHQKQGKTIA